MSWDDGLKPPHLNIASYPDSPLRVLAGPGTGKTFAMMRRVCRLLEDGEDPKKILLLTFTRIAAKDLVRKISELGVEGEDDIVATTLHSFSFSMLQREQVIEATNRIPRPLLKFEMEPLLNDLKNQNLGGIRNLKKNITAYESAWAKLQRDDPGWTQTDQERNFEMKLVSWLKFHESMLIGELIPIALEYLRYNPASLYKKKFNHIIVDEFQDLNKAEQVLIDYLAEDSKLFIAGDDDQSIYGFKHAHPEGIGTFDSTHPNTHDEILVDCRRCPKSIVRISKELISKNSRYPKNLREMPDTAEGEIHVLQWNGMRAEAKGVAQIVNHYLENEGISSGEVLILAQRKDIANMISEELDHLNLKSISSYDNDIFKGNKIAQERFVLLNLIAKPDDKVALRCWLGFPSQDWRAKPYSTLRSYCEESGDSLFEALEKMSTGKLNLPRCTSLVERHKELIDRKSGIGNEVGMELVNACFPNDVEEYGNLRDLSLGILKEDMTPEGMFKMLEEKISKPEIPQKRSEIHIMSLHKSKGLEADLIIIPSCVEGLIPRVDENKSHDEQQQELEESRRLFYVGITRTKKVLILSSFLYLKEGIARRTNIKHSTIKEGFAKVQSSTFLRELGSSCSAPITGDKFIQTRERKRA